MTTLLHLLRALSAEPLVIERRALDAFLSVLRQHGAGVAFTGPQLHAELQIAAPRPAREAGDERAVAVIPIVGAIANRAQSLGTGADVITRMIDNAMGDPRVKSIVYDVDSPGGTVTGVPEVAAKIYGYRGVKPQLAVANGLMASAAYWIGSAADEVWVTPSGEGAGSIGVIMLHLDESKALEAEGITVTELAEGKYKTEGAPWKPLDAVAEEYFRGRVREVYDWFVRDVATFRGTTPKAVREGYGEARVLPGKAAVAAGLADHVGTLEEAIAKLAAAKAPRGGARADSAALVEMRKRMRSRSAI